MVSVRAVWACVAGFGLAFAISVAGSPELPARPVSASPPLIAPANNSFATATVVGALPYSDTRSTVDATTEPGEPLPCAGIGKTVWYAFTPAVTTEIRVDTIGSSYDTVLAVHTGPSLGALSLVGCNDDFFGSQQSRLQFAANSGVTYYIQLGGFFGASGTAVLNLQALAPATFTVTSTGDGGDSNTADGICDDGTGACTVRAAIEQANANPGTDLIAFNIPGAGPHTITPASALPAIRDPLVIDGYTQPGASANTNGPGLGTNALLKIELSGRVLELAGFGAPGLVVSVGADGSRLKGLVVNRFPRAGIILFGSRGNVVEGNFIGTNVTGTAALLSGGYGVDVLSDNNTIGGEAPEDRNLISGHREGIRIEQAQGNRVVGNLIGTDASGTAPLPNGVGVLILGPPDNTIGGTTAAARNVISGNSQAGVLVSLPGSTRTRVQGNFIGTDVSGTSALGNGTGVLLSGSLNNTIGGLTPGAGNLISGNNGHGVLVGGEGNQVQANLIGTDVTGTRPLGNSLNGVYVQRASDTRVGGSEPGAGNTIAFNGGHGVFVDFFPRNAILTNSIHSNSGLGIDLAADGVTPNDAADGDTGPNNLQNFPVLTSATRSGTDTPIEGTLNSTPNATFTLQFFSNIRCDPSGYGEGEDLIGSSSVTSDAAGDVSFVVTLPIPVPLEQFITATATDAWGNTSEFSRCIPMPPPRPPFEFTVDSASDAVDRSPGDGVCAGTGGGCTIRAAVQEANALVGADIINLPPGTYTLALVGADEDAAASGDLDITDDVSIVGAGAATTIVDGHAADRVFHIGPVMGAPDLGYVTAVVSGVTIQHGDPGYNGEGGGIYNSGALTLDGVDVRSNKLVGLGNGGGIFNAFGGVLTLNSSSVRENGSVDLCNGSAVLNAGTFTSINSTISGNVATRSYCAGPAVLSTGPATFLRNTTIANNVPRGIFRSGGQVTLANSIIAANGPGGTSECRDSQGLTSLGYNLVGAADCPISSAPGDQVGTPESPVDAKLGALLSSPAYHPLLVGSSAIDAGNPADPGSGGSACEPRDQRGVTRPVDGNGDGTLVCDVGAYEFYCPPNDPDGDGVCNEGDNCPAVPNADQKVNRRDFIDLHGYGKLFDDTTVLNSTTLGDACNPDIDGDGLPNGVEAQLGPAGAAHAQCPAATGPTDALKLDTDGDGFTDRAECLLVTDPVDPASKPLTNYGLYDTDHDGVHDWLEVAIGTDPTKVDTDGDKLNDGVEFLRYGSDPLNANSDGDICSDGKEAASLNDDTNVNSTDLLIVAQSQSAKGGVKYVPDFDVNKDEKINSTDLLLVAKLQGAC